jgi:hypothetical protein
MVINLLMGRGFKLLEGKIQKWGLNQSWEDKCKYTYTHCVEWNTYKWFIFIRQFFWHLLLSCSSCKSFFNNYMRKCKKSQLQSHNLYFNVFDKVCLRASPTVPSMGSCTVKLDEENPIYAGLAQENGFGSA